MTEITKDEITELVLTEFAEHDIVDVVFKWNGNKSRHGVVRSNWVSGVLVPKELELSEVMFDALIDKHEMVDTVYHELAHVIAIKRYGRRGSGHGKLWKKVARELGCSAARCSDAEIDNDVVGYKYTAFCVCERYKERGFSRLGKNWQNNYYGNTQGRTHYVCRKCGKPLLVRVNY